MKLPQLFIDSFLRWDNENVGGNPSSGSRFRLAVCNAGVSSSRKRVSREDSELLEHAMSVRTFGSMEPGAMSSPKYTTRHGTEALLLQLLDRSGHDVPPDDKHALGGVMSPGSVSDSEDKHRYASAKSFRPTSRVCVTQRSKMKVRARSSRRWQLEEVSRDPGEKFQLGGKSP